MFKWVCLAAAVLFLVVATWMLNDLRLEIRRSAEQLQTTAQALHEHLPTIVERTRKATDVLAEHLPALVEKSKKTTDTLAEHLPDIVTKVHKTTETLADLAEDINQIKKLAGIQNATRDKNLVGFADSVLATIEASGGAIGLKAPRAGLIKRKPARDWAASARLEAVYLTATRSSKKDVVLGLAKNIVGLNWYIQLDGKEAVPLLDWLKTNHAETRELFRKD
jgi:hypothetical protein